MPQNKKAKAAISASASDRAVVRLVGDLADQSRATEILALVSQRRSEHDEHLRRLTAALDHHRERVQELEAERGELLHEISELKQRLHDAVAELKALSNAPSTSLTDVRRRVREVGGMLRKAIG